MPLTLYVAGANLKMRETNFQGPNEAKWVEAKSALLAV